MSENKAEEQKSLLWLSSILDILRKKCSWDSKQTISSLRYLTLEESYELSDAILQDNYDEMRKELGDLFMHLLFYAKLGEDAHEFTLCDVIDGICHKLIDRHPHIALPDREGTLQPAKTDKAPAWEQVKMKEGRHSVLEGVPTSLPPLVKSVRMQEKAAGVGYEFAGEKEAFDKVQEEYCELREALEERAACEKKVSLDCHMSHTSLEQQAQQHVEEEFGDLLFVMVKWGHLLGVNADDALTKANSKFYRRFTYMEQAAREEGRSLPQMTKEEMMALWRQAKQQGL